MTKSLRAVLALSVVCLLSGCATSRSILEIPPLATPSAVQPANGKSVLIDTVADQRVFDVNPGTPSVPSLDDSEKIDASVKLRAVARKRNTFGKALGDIVLKEGQSVETVTREAIRQAFIENGYTVVERGTSAAATADLTIEARIDKFWSWMNPGFAAITLSTEISTILQLRTPDGAGSQQVYVKATEQYQTAMDGNWLEVINNAVRAYIEALKAKIR